MMMDDLRLMNVAGVTGSGVRPAAVAASRAAVVLPGPAQARLVYNRMNPSRTDPAKLEMAAAKPTRKS